MAGQAIRIVLLVAAVNAAVAAQTTIVIRSGPLPTPEDIAALESHILQNPGDLDARMTLLRVYIAAAPPPDYDDPGRRSVRLQHILFLVEHYPQAAVSASRAAYVYGANGPYANVADHEAVRSQWLAAVQGHPRDKAVILNAAKFLEVEDQDDTERVLQRAMDAEPENREVAANLGFLYAMEILRPDLAAHATADMEQSSNAIVLAAAGTALPNLAVKSNGARTIDQKIFDFAEELSARARRLAPDDSDIQGLMPFIKYFADAQEGLVLPATSSPTRIKVAEKVQATNLIRKIEPQYPEEARNAGITGEVRMTAIISKDGTVQNIQLISGHPLLVSAARDAVERWQYRPTLLNGNPVEVVTTITVSLPPN